MGRQHSLFTRVRIRFSTAVKRPGWKALLVLPIALVVSAMGLVLTNNKPASAYPCPCHVLSTPSGQSDFDDGAGVELGVRFKSQIDGYITGVRFYKQGSMGGTHVGNLWQMGTGVNLASATFISESGSGWQDVVFSTPVQITADTLYVASVTMNDGKYIATPNGLATDQTNYPLVIPSSSNAPGNGVYSTTPGLYPASNSGNAANYWIDVNFKATNVATPPNVDTVTPANSATNVALGETVTATFDITMNPDSFTDSSFIVKDSGGNTLDATVSFNNSTQVASYVANDGFEVGQTYTATLKGGGSGVQNIDGTAMVSDYSWSFTATATNPCPCSVKDRAAPKGALSADETGSVELGIKLVPQTNGYLSSIRFYKPITSTVSSHDVHVWSSTGASLATATSANESDFGWQEVKLSSPLRVNKGTVYVVSFTASDGVYMATQTGVSSNLGTGYIVAYADGDSRNAATGSSNSNGVFHTGGGIYPGSAFNASYYWVDATFITDPATTVPLGIDSAQPSDGSYGVVRPNVITARLDRAPNPFTVNNATVHVVDGSGSAVAGTVGYDSANHTITFTPSVSLSYSKKYTVTLDTAIADTNGVTLAGDYVWSFTTGSQLSNDPNQGPGGPILVVTTSGDNYGKYYAEMLRTEGLNYFDVKDVTTVTASTLSSYDAVILSKMSLTQPQADMFTSWVNAGGNLVAMRPDDKLASLLGITSAGTTANDGYMLVDDASAPGQGIVSETIQYKGVADNYSLSGATGVAMLYSDASTGTSNPAVTYRDVGSNGGTAAAFTFDLARSIIALHRGNQAWAGQDRDGDGPIRSNDLYFGAKTGDVQPDYVDLNKIDIPQADEQQRLLANVITEATKDVQPMPRFWYLPHDYKAAVVLAGDDHGLSEANGIMKTYNDWLNDSSTGCSVIDWQCVRSSGYIYENSGLTTTHATQFSNAGFEVAAHPPGAGGGCNNYSSYADLNAKISDSLVQFKAFYPGLPDQRTTRYHCYMWSDWDSQPKAEYANGMRYDLNYTTYPASWIGSAAAIVTGSGMNMRFTDASGALVDVYQGVTNFENTTTSGAAIGTVLDNATGSNGYHGIFGTHFDMSGDTYYRTVYNNAVSRSVPMISSDQALTWLDGRGSSKFSNFSGSDGQFAFDITAAEGAVGLRAMMPTNDAGGTIASIKQGATTVSYTTEQVKGVSYAVFDGKPGSYTVTYSDYVAPTPGDNNGSEGSGGSGTGSGASSSGGASSGKKTAANNAGNQDSEEQAVQTPEDANEHENTPDGQDDEKTIIQTDKSSNTPWEKWLIAIIAVVLLAGIFIGLTIRRRRHTPTW